MKLTYFNFLIPRKFVQGKPEGTQFNTHLVSDLNDKIFVRVIYSCKYSDFYDFVEPD